MPPALRAFAAALLPLRAAITPPRYMPAPRRHLHAAAIYALLLTRRAASFAAIIFR